MTRRAPAWCPNDRKIEIRPRGEIWDRRLRRVIAIGVVAISGIGPSALAHAGGTGQATLTCGNQQYLVSGFGRGDVLHVVNSTSNYVVTYARTADGAVIKDAKGQQNKDTVTCEATSPITGRTFTFQGFFSPRDTAHNEEF